jgi:hypothetical protein
LASKRYRPQPRAGCVRKRVKRLDMLVARTRKDSDVFDDAAFAAIEWSLQSECFLFCAASRGLIHICFGYDIPICDAGWVCCRRSPLPLHRVVETDCIVVLCAHRAGSSLLLRDRGFGPRGLSCAAGDANVGIPPQRFVALRTMIATIAWTKELDSNCDGTPIRSGGAFATGSSNKGRSSS